MECVLNMSGTCNEQVGNMQRYRVCMVYVSQSQCMCLCIGLLFGYTLCMDYAWNRYGICMENRAGIGMESVRNKCGIDREYGIGMEWVWSMYGMRTE